MNRFNFGNQITNGNQILSVAATAARPILDASNALNNMSVSDKKELGQARAESLRQETRAIKNGLNPSHNMTDEEQKMVGQAGATRQIENARQTENQVDGMSQLTDEEQQNYGEQRAEMLRNWKYETDTPQIESIVQKTEGDINLVKDLVYRVRKNGRFAGFEKVTNLDQIIKKDNKGGKK